MKASGKLVSNFDENIFCSFDNNTLNTTPLITKKQ